MSDLRETRYGFNWGPLVVQREISDPKLGYILRVRTAHKALEIRTSPRGRVLTVTERDLYDYEKAEAS